MKRVTVVHYNTFIKVFDFNPHPLWRGWQSQSQHNATNFDDFNPHPLWRGWPDQIAFKYSKILISIHTLCEEGDYTPLILVGNTVSHFNPHPLWRGWPLTKFFSITYLKFQSTPSVKRVTDCPEGLTKYQVISIHTLCEEGDPDVEKFKQILQGISIHTLCEKGDTIKDTQ